MAAISFNQVCKAYADGQLALDHLNLDIKDGEFLVLVGPSGCGKSTALRMIAGLETVTSGELSIGGVVANDMSPRERNIAMVFQSYALYPHLTVAENVGFGLKVRGAKQTDIDARVKEVAKLLELELLLQRRPGQLSGGQRQRVAMGRAIVREPAAFLMDEPLSNLDARLRGQMRVEIAKLQRATGVTTVYVTHDQIEAMTMGDRVAVMNAGVLQQLAPPRELYDNPVNLFVATFIGSPPINLLPGRIVNHAGSLSVEMAGGAFILSPERLARSRELRDYIDQDVIVGIRPECLQLAQTANNTFLGTLAFQEDLGGHLLLHVDTDVAQASIQPLLDSMEEDAAPAISSRIRVSAPPTMRFVTGERISVGVNPAVFHFFDPDTQLAIR